ncbi:MAG: nitrogen fixation protein NifH [Actinomycetota bacterium]
MGDWRSALRSDPLPWLLEQDAPAVRHLALRMLLDEPEDAPTVRRARSRAMRVDPIAAVLDAQESEGYWVKPGSGYGPKYTGTVWSVIFLDQMGADPRDRRVRRAAEYVLEHSIARNGGFGASGSTRAAPADSSVYHCLNGNLLRAVIGFGYLDDPRTQGSIGWEARSIVGEGFEGYHRWGTSGPGFSCAINGTLPCAWGANKALRGLTRIPARRRTALVRRAIDSGSKLLLSIDPSTAEYPTDTKVSGSWFKLGFPLGYVGDVLETLEALADAGRAKDPRLGNAIEWVLSLQDDRGRWRNRHAYNKKTWGEVEPQGAPSKWVTLRACAFLKRGVA